MTGICVRGSVLLNSRKSLPPFKQSVNIIVPNRVYKSRRSCPTKPRVTTIELLFPHPNAKYPQLSHDGSHFQLRPCYGYHFGTCHSRLYHLPMLLLSSCRVSRSLPHKAHLCILRLPHLSWQVSSRSSQASWEVWIHHSHHPKGLVSPLGLRIMTWLISVVWQEHCRFGCVSRN